MINWIISSVQQYTIDRFRVSFSMNYDTSDIEKLSYTLKNNNTGEDVTSHLKTLIDSNNFEFVDEADYFDIYIEKNSSLEAGKYVFTIFDKDTNEIYSSRLDINYMEDIRIKISDVHLESLNKLHITFKSLDEENPTFQTKKMLSLTKLSFMEASGNTEINYSSSFIDFSEILDQFEDDEVITEFTLPLTEGKVLPKGYYKVRLTSRYKSRTFSLVENEFQLNFMTNTPPVIGSTTLVKKAENSYALRIIFSSFIESSMFYSATRHIISDDNKDISYYFDADRISTLSLSNAGISYITRVDIPLVEEFYTVKKGLYTVKYEWNTPYFKQITGTLDTDWCLKDFKNIELVKLDQINFTLPEGVKYNYLKNLKYKLEINGNDAPEDAYQAFKQVFESTTLPSSFTEEYRFEHFSIKICDSTKIKDGNYSFIFYYESAGTNIYDYLGTINFKEELMPVLQSGYSSSIDTIKLELEKELPISVLEYCQVSLIDQYGLADYSNKLISIKDSNVWLPGQTTTKTLDIGINDVGSIASGTYKLHLIFGKYNTEDIIVPLQYMESRKGVIQNIEQTALNKFKITFSESQSRQFLMSTYLDVERKLDGANYTDKFELLSTTLKEGNYSFTELDVPLRHEASIPHGRYTISLKCKSKDGITVIYSYDVYLSYMTDNIPKIAYVLQNNDTNGLLTLNTTFNPRLEEDLYDNASFSLLSGSIVSQLNELHTQIRSIQYDLFAAQDEYTEDTQIVNNAKSKLDSANERLPEADQELTDARQLINDNTEKLNQLDNEEYDTVQTVTNLSEQAQAIQEQMNGLNPNSSEYNALSTSYDNKLEKLDAATVKLYKIRSKISQLNIECNETYDKINNLEIEIDQLNDTIDDSNDEVSYYESRISELNTEINDYTSQVSTLQSQEASLLENVNISNKFSPKEDWSVSTSNLNSIKHIATCAIKLKNKDQIIEKDKYTINFSWNGDYKYLEDVKTEISLDFILPFVEKTEVVDYDPSHDYVRLYFKFPLALQYSFFKDLKVQVFNNNGIDCTDLFESVENSNTITEGMSSSDLNLDSINSNYFAHGPFTFIFYHVNDGVRTSAYIAKIDILDAITPEISEVEQYSTDKLLITLKSGIPRDILEKYTMHITSFNNEDFSDYFLSITESNDWAEDVTDVSSFYIELCDGLSIDKNTYSVELCANDIAISQAQIDIEKMKKVLASIKSIKPLNLSTLLITFKQEQSADIFKTLTFEVRDSSENIINDKFVDTENILRHVDSDYFDTIELKLSAGSVLPEGDYSFNVIKENSISDDSLLVAEIYHIPFMSATYPELYDVSLTVDDGESYALIAWFSPALEKSLFDNSDFYLRLSDNADICLNDKFEKKSEARLITSEKDGITYVDYMILEFLPGNTLNKNAYNTSFEWTGKYDYMKDLVRRSQFDYILLPVKSIVQKGGDGVEITFKEGLSKAYLEQAVLVVQSAYSTTNEDGTIITDVDFTNYFKTIQESNDFSQLPDNDIRSIDVKINDHVVRPLSIVNFDEPLHYDLTKLSGNMTEIENGIQLESTISNEKPSGYIKTLDVRYTGHGFSLDHLDFDLSCVSYTGESNKGIFKIVDVDYSTPTPIETTLYEKELTGTTENEHITVKCISSDHSIEYRLLSENTESECNFAIHITNATATIIGVALPPSLYRFIIASPYIDKNDIFQLEYVYGGSIQIDLLLSENYFTTDAILNQISYNKLKLSFTKEQDTRVFNNCTFKIIRKLENEEDADMTSMFENIPTSNTYTIINDDGTTETGYYVDSEKKDMIIDDIHYTLLMTEAINLRLKKDCAIPAGNYSFVVIYNNKNYYAATVTTTFMTDNPPKISGAYINTELKTLDIEFEPMAEQTSLKSAVFSIMTNRGYNKDGTIKGTDMTSYFGGISNAAFDIADSQNGIVYIPKMSLPVKKNAFIPSGLYHMGIDFDDSTFFDTIYYDSALTLLGHGVKSAETVDYNAIRFVLDDKYLAEAIKDLDLVIYNNAREDVTELFKSLKDSNIDIKDDEETDTYYLYVNDDQEVITDTYTFELLSSDSPEDDDDDNSEDMVPTTVFSFGMTIAYLTDKLPVLTNVNNLCDIKYEVVTLNNYNINTYMGRRIVPIDSMQMFDLSEMNKSQFLDKVVRLYDPLDISTLYFEFSDYFNPCVLNVSQFHIKNTEGVDFSDRFASVLSANDFKTMQVLDTIEFTFNFSHRVSEFEDFTFTIMNYEEEDITHEFDIRIGNSTDTDNTFVNKVTLTYTGDRIYQETDVAQFNIGVINGEDTTITGFTHKETYQSNSDINEFKLSLDANQMLIPGMYTIEMTYQNEKGMEDATDVTFATYNGELPFLDTNVGIISSILQPTIDTLAITFSEDLPTVIFDDIDIAIINGDGIDASSCFLNPEDSNKDTNDLNGVEYISQLPNPYTIYLKLLPAKTVMSGKYNFIFQVPIEAEPPAENEEDTDISNKKTLYTIWNQETTLGYMSNDLANNIKSAEMVDIDKVRFNLEYPVDANLIKQFKFTALNQFNNYLYDESFYDAIDCNDFGKYVLISDNRFITYSTDGIDWSTFDTGKNIELNDLLYDPENATYFVACGVGTILAFKEFDNSKITVIKADTSKRLTSIHKISSNLYLVTGTDGTLIQLVKTGDIYTPKMIDVTVNTNQKVMTSFMDAYIDGNKIIVVGLKGTIVISNDKGATWKKVPTGILQNLMSITKHEKPTITAEETNSDLDTDDSEYQDDGADDASDDIQNDIENGNYGYYIVGTNGIVLYSENGESYSVIDSGITTTLYSVISHDTSIIAVGDYGTIIKSDDTHEWSSIPSNVTFALRDIKYCDTSYLICGSTGKWLTSTSGESWSENSDTYTNSLRAATYVVGQYPDNRKIDWFYAQLKPGEELGVVNFYSGYEIPTFANVPAVNWTSDDICSMHIGDIYSQYATVNYETILTATYQFKAIPTYDENGIITNLAYDWIKVDSAVKPFSSQYTFNILLNNEDNDLWRSIKDVNIWYMISDPGEFTSIAIHSPDDHTEIEYDVPYLYMEMDGGNENAIYYSRYEIFDPNGNEVSNYFKSLRQSIKTYDSNLNVNALTIFGTDSIYELSSGTYTLKWYWMATGQPIIKTFQFNHLTKSIWNSIPVKGDNSKIKRHNESASALDIMLDVPIPLTYLIGNKREIKAGTAKVEIPAADIYMLKYNDTDVNSDTSYNYFSSFKNIDLTNDFTASGTVQIEGNTTLVKKLSIEVDDGFAVKGGRFLLKMLNPSYEKDAYTTDIATTTQFSFDGSLVSSMPELYGAKVSTEVEYVAPKVDDRIPENYDGDCEPNQNDTINTLVNTWKETSGVTDVQKLHVGDTYTDNTTLHQYAYYYDDSTKQYYWKSLKVTSYLEVSFSGYPDYEQVLKNIRQIKLLEIDEDNSDNNKDLTKYLVTDQKDWKYETFKRNDIDYVYTIYIPFDETKSFPGTQNGRFAIYWKQNDGTLDPVSIYAKHNVLVDNLVLEAVMHDYGNIEVFGITVLPATPPTDTSNHKYGLRVKFERDQFVSFLTKADYTLCKVEYTDDPDDPKNKIKKSTEVTGYFANITETNDFTDIVTTNEIYFELLEDQVIEAGTYELTITGERPVEDAMRPYEGDLIFTATAELPWASSSAYPKDIKVKFFKKLDGYNRPVLRIYFNNGMPPKSSFKGWKPYIEWLADRVIYHHTHIDIYNADLKIPAYEYYVQDVNAIDLLNATTAKAKQKEWEKIYTTLADEALYNEYLSKVGTKYESVEYKKDSKTYYIKYGQYQANTNMTKRFYYTLADSKYTYSKDKKTITKMTRDPLKAHLHYYDWKDYEKKADSSSKFKKMKEIEDNPNSYVDYVDILVKKVQYLPKGTYDVSVNFAPKMQLDSLPKAGVHRSFTLSKYVVTKLADISYVKVKGNKSIIVGIKPDPSINTNAKLRKKWFAAHVMDTVTWSELVSHFDFQMIRNGKNKAKVFKSNPTYNPTKKTLTFTLKDSTKINPAKFKFGFNMNGVIVIPPKLITDFKGVINNKIGNATKDKVCYELVENHNGTKYRKIYSSYTQAMKRVNRLKALNKANPAQRKKCAECRKKYLISSKKVKAQIEKYDIPYTSTKIYKTVNKLTHVYYDRIVAPKLKCKKYQWVFTDPFDFQGDKYVKIHCEHYVPANYKYTWVLRICTHVGKFPKKNDHRRMHSIYVVRNGAQLDRYYPSTKAGKMTEKAKKYQKWLKAKVKKIKSQEAFCRRCKSTMLVTKSTKPIGWGYALMPDSIRTAGKGYSKQIAKYLEDALKTKAELSDLKPVKSKVKETSKKQEAKKKITAKAKKKKTTKKYKISAKNKVACKNPKIKIVKRDSKYCRFSCSNAKKTDETLKTGSLRGTYMQ